MNCPICFDIINTSCTGSCNHHFCYRCLLKWCYNGGKNCPICKQIIFELRFDKEFDSINNPDSAPLTFDYCRKITVNFLTKIRPGITLINNKGPGVKIKELNKNDQCFLSGLRTNMLILFLDNVPCTNHIDSIKIIENAYKCRRPLLFEIMIMR